MRRSHLITLESTLTTLSLTIFAYKRLDYTPLDLFFNGLTFFRRGWSDAVLIVWSIRLSLVVSPMFQVDRFFCAELSMPIFLDLLRGLGYDSIIDMRDEVIIVRPTTFSIVLFREGELGRSGHSSSSGPPISMLSVDLLRSNLLLRPV